MTEYLIRGGAPLRGELMIQGAKNSVLPILAASVLTRGECVLQNCPNLSDVEAACSILRHLGAKVEREADKIIVNAANIHRGHIPNELMQTMRSSVLFLGPLLARLGTAEISLPGGCELGPRPVDLHLEALRSLGAEIMVDGSHIFCRGALRGGTIRLRYPSVGATENAMAAAAAADGETVIEGAAREPEICDLAAFLRAAGAQITGDGTPTIMVKGQQALCGAEHRVMPDRIVTATWLCATAAAGGEVLLRDARPAQLAPVLAVLARAGAKLELTADAIRMRSDHLTAPGSVQTGPHPGFPTDAQAPVMAALLRADGETRFRETVFSARYAHVPELRKLGAHIALNGDEAVLTGVRTLHGAALQAKDLRGGAAVVVGALAAEGESRISGVRHIERGYEDLPRDLERLGAQIKRLETDEEIVYTT